MSTLFLIFFVISQKPLFIVLTKADTNFILLTKTPKYGAEIYRKGPGEKEFKKLTTSPLKPAESPEEVRAILGQDYEYIAEIMGATDEIRLLSKLKYSSFRGGILSLTNLRVAKLLGRLYLDYPVEKGETYTYRVVYLKFRGKGESETRKHRSVEILPEPPTNISLKPGDKKIEIKWTYKKWKGDLNDLVISFNIYRRLKGEKNFEKINPYPILRENEGKFSYVDSWVDNGKTYEYAITSTDVIGRESPASKVVSATPIDKTPPEPPTGLVVVDRNGSAYLRWNMSLELDVKYYNVYRNTYIGEKFKKINTKPIPYEKPEFTDTTVLPGKRYFYAVTAVDSNGNESKKSNSMMVHIRDTIPPNPPASVKAYYLNKTIRITWKPSKSKDLMGYYIYRGTIKKQVPKINLYPLPPNATSFVDSGYGGKGFSPGLTYYVGVTAVDSSRNESKLQLIKVVVPDSEPPKPPYSVSVFNLKEGFVRVSFTPSPSLDVKYYRIYRIHGDKKISLTQLPKDKHMFTDSTATIGKTYIYEITAVDTIGNEGKPAKSRAIKVIEKIPPLPPKTPRAFVTENGIKILWKASPSEDVIGYYVYRSKYPNGYYRKLNEKPLKTMSFLDKEGKKYHFYKVSAVDRSGNEGMSRYFRPKKAR